MKRLSLVFLSLYCIAFANAQTAFTTSEYLDVNKIKATVLVHGDFWKDAAGNSGVEFPKGSGKYMSHGGGVWMSAYDDMNQLHVSAQTNSQTGNDYWPGPLDNSGSVSYAKSSDWARIWKVNKSDITSFLATTPHTTANTPAAILEWPAKGNPNAKGANGAPLTINDVMAPFIDVNSDFKYNALDGDYPAIKGDQFLWWVFNDNGATHDAIQSPTQPLGVQVRAYAYAFDVAPTNGSAQDKIVYYEFDVTNKSALNLNGMRFGLFNDFEVGDRRDDFVGFDSTRRMGIGYNGYSTDNVYGSSMPVIGTAFLNVPGDAGSIYAPLGSFMSYGGGSGPSGSPQSAADYNNYMRSTWKDGLHLKRDFNSPGIPSLGRGVGRIANYIFDGDPGMPAEWSECVASNFPDERNFVISTGDFVLTAGVTAHIAIAMVLTEPYTSSCPNANFDEIKRITDTAWKVYNGIPALSVSNTIANKQFKAYPNPATQRLYIETAAANYATAQVQVYDAVGRKMDVKLAAKNGKIELDIQALPAGMYYANCRLDGMNETVRFMKQ